MTAVAPFVTSQVMAVGTAAEWRAGLYGGRDAARRDSEEQSGPHRAARSLQSGSLSSLERDASGDVTDNGVQRQVELPGAIIGKTLGLDLGGVRVGDTITLVSPASLAGAAGGPRLKRFIVTGFFYSGMYDFDSTLIFIDLKAGRALLADDPQLESGLEARVSQHFRCARYRGQDCRARGSRIHGHGLEQRERATCSPRYNWRNLPTSWC